MVTTWEGTLREGGRSSAHDLDLGWILPRGGRVLMRLPTTMSIKTVGESY